MKSDDFLPYLHAFTEHDVELRSFPNKPGDGRARPLFTRDTELIAAHIGRFDTPGRGMYFGACTRLRGQRKGDRKHVMECPGLWLDIDDRHSDAEKSEAIAALKSALHRPNLVIDTGGGVQAFWRFSEPLDVAGDTEEGSANEQVIVAALKQFADIFGGDPSVCEIARVMRMPGTHNSKYEGEPRPVIILDHHEGDHHLEDIVDWLDLQPSLLISGNADEGPGNEKARPNPGQNDPYLTAAQHSAGWAPPLDIEQLLRDMAPGNIHDTQLRASASMVATGSPDEEIVEILMRAAREAARVAGETCDLFHLLYRRWSKSLGQLTGNSI
ncbi:MAG: DNA-primase RepB domain-containing protein [Rhodospirillales bacterium]|jgi:hypothetical protein|nr:DNA-primase RepB domain-containing protein [Rhodospirillales bacterium]|tara:strand:+ start:130 stop:1110 length:981 start_codon:yes stop_codon:yes gene_type:complete